MANVREKSSKGKTPYSQASDDEKVARNWNKALGLFRRREYSVAIIRCGTCIELAVNFAIRQELFIERELPLPFVDGLLKSANGLRNKYQNIYLPIMAELEEHDSLKRLWKLQIEKINQQRNAVAHSGEFRSRSTAKEIMEKTHNVLVKIMALYGTGDDLKKFEP